MSTFIKLNRTYLNLERVTDIVFQEDGEAIVYLDTLEQQPCPCEDEQCERMVHDQAYRVFCPHSAQLLRAYLERVAEDPRTPVPEIFREGDGR